MKNDLIVTNCLLPCSAEDSEPYYKGYATITNGLFTAFGEMTAIVGAGESKQSIDARGALMMPGLVNCHCHAAMTLFRGYADDMPLMSWLHDYIFPAEATQVKEEMVYWCTKLAVAEMLLSGTTAVADSYFHEDWAAKAFRESGMRAVVAQGIIDFPAPGVPDPAYNIDKARLFLDLEQKKDGLVQPALFCHSPYTCSPETIRKAKQLAVERGVPLFLHVAETQEEGRIVRESYGLSPIGHLATLGVLDQQTVLVHCVWLEDSDWKILAETGARVVSCPESNMKLASGTAPVSKLVEKQVLLGLGTDSCASNNDLDLFGEMGSLARHHKGVSCDPTVLPASQVLKMATEDGAQILALPEGCGRLQVGGAADCILIDLAQPHLTPFFGQNLLVYAAKGSDVRWVIVNGQLLVENRNLLSFDVGEVRQRVLELAEPLQKFSSYQPRS